MSFENVGKVWDEQSFRNHVAGVDLSRWSGITLHHTAAPSLAQRPNGLRIQHIRNIEDFYRRKLRWSRGPHLFTDEDQVFGMTPLHLRGTHARSFNATHVGIEMLGNFDTEDPENGRGAQVVETTAIACAILLARMGKTESTINGHRDDPKTSKSCPGRRFDLEDFRAAVGRMLRGEHDDRSDDPAVDAEEGKFRELAEEVTANISWQLRRLLKGVGK